MASLNQNIMQQMRKEEYEHRRIVRRAAALGVAFDEGEVEELTTNDLAAKVLKKLGLETPRNGNHIEALNGWLAGHEQATDRLKGRVRGALDQADEPAWFTNITKAR